MKQLKQIRLINWHLFENSTIDCQGTTYFIGTNGVGKSTILDAVQFALVGGQRDVRFNRAAMDGGKRTLSSYVRGELGTEGQRYLRGDSTAVIALEFRNPDETAFVHGAVIDAHEDNRSPDIVYFIIHDAPLNDAWFFRSEGQLFDSRRFRRHMDNFAIPGGRAQTFTRLEDYRFHLLNRLGQLKESFPAKVVKGLAFSPLTNIREFVHSYLLDEHLVDVDALREQLETMRHFETLAADIRQRISALDKIVEIDQERLSQRRLRLINGYCRRYATSDVHLNNLKKYQLELDQTQVDLSRLNLEREDQTDQLNFARQNLIEAQVNLRADATAAQEAALRDTIAKLETSLTQVNTQAQALRQTLTQEIADAARLQTLLTEDKQDIPETLPTLSQAKAQTFDLPIETITALQNDLQTLGNHYTMQRALLEQQSRTLIQEAKDLNDQITKLRIGDRTVSYEAVAPQSSQLRRLLRAELSLDAEDVIFFCTALTIPDESWQDAVEGILGRTRFDLLVPPAHYDAAMQLYRQRRQADRLHGVGLIDTARILQNKRDPRPDSLATEVQTDHPAAQAFVNLLLGGYVKCDTLEALRDHRTAVTRDCFVRRNFTSMHLNPQHYKRWFIGDRAIPRQIEQCEERLTAIAAETAALQSQINQLNERLALTRDKISTFIGLSRDLPILAQLPALKEDLAQAKQALAALDTQSIEGLKKDVSRHEKRVSELEKTVDGLNEAVGGLKNRLETLRNELMPNLERQAEEALQEANGFMIMEEADDLLEQAQTEYERRRSRQPVATIQENSSTNESRYHSAESRLRDSLREGKQSYSLAYQFGTDDDENADRYEAERQRYVESELPEYENRIAEQRTLAEQELVENFIHRLREQIDEARQQLRYLNATLSTLRFGGERFEFITRPEPSLRQVYDMIQDSQAVLGESLFESGFRQRHQVGWDLLFDRLTADGDETLTELRELQDYRNYLQYDIRVHYANGDRALLSQINAKKSGGETTTPFYVAMAASFAQAYRLNQPRPADTIRLALFDEAFGKMDTARTASALQFMVDSKLQVILATPPDKAAGLLPHVDSVRTVVRQDNHAFVINIDKEDMLKELQGT